MSHFRRLAAAGMALACAGIFIGAPAQAAAAHPAASAKAVAQSAGRSVGRTAASGYQSFSSTAKSAGRTSVKARSVLPYSAQATSNVIYVLADPVHCTKELGAGTNADPYCLLQSAVNAAVAGDTIEVWQNDDDTLAYNEPVVVNGKSGLTIVGEGIGIGDIAPSGRNALEIEYSSNITVRNLVWDSSNTDTVVLYQSSGVTLDGDSLLMETGPNDALIVGSGMSGTTISRSTLGNNGGGEGAWIYSGAQNTVLASNVVSARLGTGVSGYSISGLNVVGNTIDRGCGGSVAVSDASTQVSIEDNVFEVGALVSGVCQAANISYTPVVNVDASSAAGTTTDYNDFTFSSDGSQAYAWSGTTYATLAAFQAAVAQAAHDAVDPTRDLEMYLTPGGVNTIGTPLPAYAVPTGTSLSIGTANTSAPGYLSTDFYGRGSYSDRGALKYVVPSLTAAETVYQTGARTVEAYADTSVEPDAFATYYFNWGDGTAPTGPTATAIASHTYASPGTYSVTVTVDDVFGDSSSATVSAQTAGSDYTPVGPVRVLDTRKGTGTGGVIAAVGSKQTLALKIAGVGSVPATATAVALNLTVTDAKGYGFVTAYPAGSSVPITSNVNFSTGSTVANMSIVPIGTDGTIELYNGGTGSVDLVADEAGYFSPTQADAFASFNPVRLLDTRTATGGHHAPLTESDPVRLKVAGVGGVPANAKAVAVNLTAASPTKAGYIRAFPDGGSVPGVSNVNFNANQVIANAAIVPVGADGYIDVTLTGSGSLRMIVDVDGFFSADPSYAISAYEPVTPFRFLDSRTIKNGTLRAGYYYYLPLGTDFWGNVLPTVTGTVTNVTVTQTTATSGDLIAFPDRHDPATGNLLIPSTSTLNFTKGATVPNLAITAPGSDGDVDYLNQSAGNLQLIVDVSGYFQSQ